MTDRNTSTAVMQRRVEPPQVRACFNCGAKTGVRCVDDRCCERDDREEAFTVALECAIITNRVVPVAAFHLRWQTAWDAACLAQAGDLGDYERSGDYDLPEGAA